MRTLLRGITQPAVPSAWGNESLRIGRIADCVSLVLRGAPGIEGPDRTGRSAGTQSETGEKQVEKPRTRFSFMECAAVREFTGIHNMIRGLIRLMESAMSEAKPKDTRQMKVLSDFGLFAVAGTHFHHSGEDDYYWPAVVRNGADASLLDPLVKEHHMIDPLLDETQRAFETLRRGPSDTQTIESLGALVSRFKGDMLAHLDNEEPIFFPLLNQYMPDDESERLAGELAKKAPRKGISWLMGGVEYGMTKEESAEFLATFPKPIQWLRPSLLRRYKRNCGVLGVDPALPSQH
jgi:hemerythrin-like domain-containing protein